MKKKDQNKLIIVGIVVLSALALIYYSASSGQFVGGVNLALPTSQPTTDNCILDGRSVWVSSKCTEQSCDVTICPFACECRKIPIESYEAK